MPSSVDPLAEITVTCGATEALYDAIQAVIGPGDEAIVFDPAYDAYEPAVRLAAAAACASRWRRRRFASIGIACGRA